MKTMVAIALTAVLMACGGKNPTATAPHQKTATAAGLKIKLATVYVDDQEKALRFYTDVLGFAKKDDVTNGGYRWLTVASPADPEGAQLLLARNDSPAVKAYQESMFKQSQPAVMFFTDDVKADYERIKARGAELTMPPTEVMAGSVIVMLKDTCGNLVQLTQLAH